MRESLLTLCSEFIENRDVLKVAFPWESTAKLPMIAMLAADNEPEGKMNRALSVYDSLKEYFGSSQYLSAQKGYGIVGLGRKQLILTDGV